MLGPKRRTAITTHILIVEDDPDSAQLLSWILEDEGYTVSTVESGEQCLSILERTHFDVILMDISLPGIDGKETTQRIRMSPKTTNIPILALTAYNNTTVHQSILESGVNDILTKPVNNDLLCSSIKKHL